MIIKPFELIPINTRHDVVDFIYFLYNIYMKTNKYPMYDIYSHKTIYNKYVFNSIISDSDNVHLDTYYDQHYIEIGFNDIDKTIELNIQIDDRYKLNDTEPHSYICSIAEFLKAKDTEVETNAVSMILNVIYDSREFINKAIQEGFDMHKSLINITRAIKE